MKITKKLSVVALIVLMLVSAFSTFAYADNFDINAFETPGKAGNVKKLVNNTAATVITAARIICVTIAIVILLVIATFATSFSKVFAWFLSIRGFKTKSLTVLESTIPSI